MSRCVCCNVAMTWRDIKIQKPDGTEEDMCSLCLGVAYSPEFCDSHSYQFEDICDVFYVPEVYEE